MIYTYKRIDHNINLLHEHLAFIFRQMFRYAPATFDEELLVHPDFIPILEKAKVSIRKPLAEIVELFHKLPYGEKKKLEIAFSYNNSIESLTNKNVHPIKYIDLDDSISKKLKDFSEKLWKEYPQVAQIGADFGTLKQHYDKIVNESEVLVCPFCGIGEFEPPGGKYKEAYDHLIAKATYPFVAVNFDLLFPMCHKCNSKEKGSEDTYYDAETGERRTVLYPYDDTYASDDLAIRVILNEPYDKIKLETILRSIDWNLDLTLQNIKNETLNTWNSIFHIKRRFGERLKYYEKHWFDELVDKYKDSLEDGISFSKFKKRFLGRVRYQIKLRQMGMIRFTYFSFLFSLKNFEANLKKTVN